MWELDHKEGWALKNWCFQNVVLEKTPLDWKETKAVNPKGNQSWIFIGRTDAEAEAPILWPPDVKSQLTEKDPDAGKDRVGKRRRKLIKCYYFSCCCLYLVTQLCPTLWPYELQHVRLSCPSLSPWVCPNSCLLCQWCHPTISVTSDSLRPHEL